LSSIRVVFTKCFNIICKGISQRRAGFILNTNNVKGVTEVAMFDQPVNFSVTDEITINPLIIFGLQPVGGMEGYFDCNRG
jgi:hypothetical protein